MRSGIHCHATINAMLSNYRRTPTENDFFLTPGSLPRFPTPFIATLRVRTTPTTKTPFRNADSVRICTPGVETEAET
jgi:hypothetical protein